MTYDKYFDTDFTYSMLVGFRLFLTPTELFSELISKFDPTKFFENIESESAPTSYAVPPQPSKKQHTLEGVRLEIIPRFDS